MAATSRQSDPFYESCSIAGRQWAFAALYSTKVKDSAGNLLADNAIQRVRGLASTLKPPLPGLSI